MKLKTILIHAINQNIARRLASRYAMQAPIVGLSIIAFIIITFTLSATNSLQELVSNLTMEWNTSVFLLSMLLFSYTWGQKAGVSNIPINKICNWIGFKIVLLTVICATIFSTVINYTAIGFSDRDSFILYLLWILFVIVMSGLIYLIIGEIWCGYQINKTTEAENQLIANSNI